LQLRRSLLRQITCRSHLVKLTAPKLDAKMRRYRKHNLDMPDRGAANL
jgi:hypothetical protein